MLIRARSVKQARSRLTTLVGMKDAQGIPSTSRSMLARILWRIEAGLDGPLSLTGLAASEGVTAFHLSRAFSLALGVSPMAYVKARRLSEAARALRETDAKIVEIALAAGYDSHEGFSRSFRTMFGQSPRDVRSSHDISPNLQEAIFMPNTEQPKLVARIETRPSLRLAGLSRRYTMATRAAIPRQWEEFAAELGDAVKGIETFGACYDFHDDSFSYLCGFVDDGRVDTEPLDHLTIPGGDYAVFDHDAHISTISETWSAIFETWVPKADVAPGEGPEFEHYAKDFDVGKPGGVSVCIPIVRKA